MRQLCVHRDMKHLEVWRALKKLELLSATHLSCSPNFPGASYLDDRTLTHESIVKFQNFNGDERY